MPHENDLRDAMQRMLRRFGALAADRTPCGKALPISHAHALMVLRERGDLSQRDLGEALGIDKSNVARLCARLEGSGHVTQEVCVNDARSRRIALTAKGRKLGAEVDASSAARFRALLHAIPQSRRAPVLRALEELVTAMATLDREERQSA